MELEEIKRNIAGLKSYWVQRNLKFRDWYEILIMVDALSKKGMESYVSNEPQTFYDMAHYLLTRGNISHSAPMMNESAIELDKRARIDRGCKYNWLQIDRERKAGGSPSYIDELGFYLLLLGWYATMLYYDKDTGRLKAQLWNPYDTYPFFGNGQLSSCVHSYLLTESEAILKAQANGWNYEGRTGSAGISSIANVKMDDFWLQKDNKWHNVVLFDDKIVDGWAERPNAQVLVAPVAGFPDKGSLTPGRRDWKRLIGRGIFEVNEPVTDAFNKWRTMISQILRDTAQPITQEFSQSPQATPEQLTERGSLFHYGVGEQGLQRVPPAAIPIEIQANLMDIRKELQKGSFTDAVWGMVERQPGYALSIMATSSANQILYPYMDAKHFIIEEADRFWLSHLKSSNRTFNIKGKLIEKLKPADIPEDVSINVESEVATAKDWLERATIANQLKEHLDPVTILGEVLGQGDPQAILRNKDNYEVMHSPEAMALKKIAAFRGHARYLEFHGDPEQARAFKKAADALEQQMMGPPPGQTVPSEMGRVEAEREAGAPKKRPTIRPEVSPPEARGFTPQELRNRIGAGKAIRG